MSAGAPLPFRTGFLSALEVVHLLLPGIAVAPNGVPRVEIAGSIRRVAPTVSDIEIVCIPRMGTEPRPPTDLFGGAATAEVNLLEAKVAELLAAGHLTTHPERPANGPKYKRLWLPRPGIQVDLFIVTEETYAAALLVRTGSADFSRTMVTALRARGLHLEELRVKKLEGGEVVPCPDEQTFFRLAGRPFLPAEFRQ